MQEKLDDPNYDVAMALYNHTCILCGDHAVAIHEIVPKSKNPKHWRDIDNRVALCNVCHNTVHVEGTRNSEAKLRDAQHRYLDSIGSSIV